MVAGSISKLSLDMSSKTAQKKNCGEFEEHKVDGVSSYFERWIFYILLMCCMYLCSITGADHVCLSLYGNALLLIRF